MLSLYQTKIEKLFGNRLFGNRSIELLCTCYRFPGVGATKLQFLSTEGYLLERILRRVHPQNLIWLSWTDCPYSYLPSWIPMRNLRVLKVQGKVLETLWQGKSQVNLNFELEFVCLVAIDIAPHGFLTVFFMRSYIYIYLVRCCTDIPPECLY